MTGAALHLAAPPLAHLGHWLWVFYVIPVLIVVGGIVYSARAEKRRESEEDDGAGKGSAGGRTGSRPGERS